MYKCYRAAENVFVKQQEMLESWYKNYFMTHVRNHQREKNINNTKVMLLLENDIEFTLLKNITDTDFETRFFPEKSDLAPLHQQLLNDFRYKLRTREFPNPSNIGDCIKVMCDKWTNYRVKKLTSIYRKRWSNFTRDVPIEENNPSTSVVTQTSDKNVIEENTTSKEIPEDPQNSGLEKLQQEEAATKKRRREENVIEENTASKEIPEDPQNSGLEKLQQEETAVEENIIEENC
ncbi:uncharacterized protein [Anoplolepis gracilipes]|uniref:uncharacterized protein isoform X3 n=1 Tax=Anoplolepis gracilipes TaxID=354296 RepID=UPI003BA15111